MTRVWNKEKSEYPTEIESMTSRTPDGRSIHLATRSHGEQVHLTELTCEQFTFHHNACHMSSVKWPCSPCFRSSVGWPMKICEAVNSRLGEELALGAFKPYRWEDWVLTWQQNVKFFRMSQANNLPCLALAKEGRFQATTHQDQKTRSKLSSKNLSSLTSNDKNNYRLRL